MSADNDEALLPRLVSALERIADDLDQLLVIIQPHGVPATEIIPESARSKQVEKEKEEEESVESGEG